MGTVGFREPIPPMVSIFTRGWGFVDEGIAAAAPASTGWESNDRGVWYPIYVPVQTVATRMWWANGSTVDAGYNLEAGFYYTTGDGKPGGKYWTTGSTAQGTASQVQFVNIDPDVRLDPGLWWLYLSCSTTSATLMNSSPTTSQQVLYKFQQASVGPGSAPDPATPAESASARCWLFGFSTNTVT